MNILRKSLLAVLVSGVIAIPAVASNHGTHDKAAGTIVEVAASNADFETLVAAVNAAGLAETLRGAGPFTVFAPTDEAFAKLPAGTVENLLKPENKDKLVALLTYSPLDAAWSNSGTGGPVLNRVGRLGAWLADLSYFLL